MSGSNGTVNANGSVTIVATSPVTESVISAVFAAVTSPAISSSFTYSNTSGPIPTVAGPNSVLYVAPGTTGSISVPAGYEYVLVDQTASTVALSGGDPAATVIGDAFTYTGGATMVASGAGDASMTDNGAGATIVAGSQSTMTALGGGADQTIEFGAGAMANVTAAGAGSTVLGGASSSSTIVATDMAGIVSLASNATASIVGFATQQVFDLLGSDSVTLNAATVGGAFVNIVADPNSTVTALQTIVLTTSDTVNAGGGIADVYAGAGDIVRNTGGSLNFVGQGATSTVFGGIGATTVTSVETAGQVFEVGQGATASANNIFVGGGTAASTIIAGTGGGDFFGGSHGDLYSIGSSTQQTFVGLGGNDTLTGDAGSVAPTIFATGAENMLLTSSAPAVTVVGFESGGSIDASTTNGNNVFFTGYGATGNETLIGSTATIGGAHDVFELGDSTLAGATTATVPANVTISDFHTGDAFFLIGYGSADNTTMDNAVTAANATGSALHFQLSDGTQVTFVGSHPTGINPAANAIF